MFPDVRNHIASHSAVKRVVMRVWRDHFNREFPEDHMWDLTDDQWIFWLTECRIARLAAGWFDFGFVEVFPTKPRRPDDVGSTEEYSDADTVEY